MISLRGALINFFSGHFIRLCVNFALRLVKNRVKAKNAFYRVKKLSIARALVNSNRTGVGFLQGKVQVLILVKTKLSIARALVNSTRTGVGLVRIFF